MIFAACFMLRLGREEHIDLPSDARAFFFTSFET